MKKYLLLIVFILSFFTLQSQEVLQPFSPGGSYSTDSPLAGKTHSFDSNLGPSTIGLRNVPDLGDDIEGGGGTGIGREIPVDDSGLLLSGILLSYCSFLIWRNRKKAVLNYPQTR